MRRLSFLLVSFLLVLLMAVLTVPSAAAQSETLLDDTGNGDVEIPALGNTDEVGKLARALTLYKAHLAEISHLHGELGRAKSALETRPGPPADAEGQDAIDTRESQER